MIAAMVDSNEVRAAAAAAAPAPAPAGATPVLAARGLYRFRPVNDQQVPILRDVSFALQPREFVEAGQANYFVVKFQRHNLTPEFI